MRSLIPFNSALVATIAVLATGCTSLPRGAAPTGAPVNEAAAAAYTDAVSLARAGDNDAAEAALLELTLRHPDSATAHATLGMLYARTDRDEKATVSLNQAVALQPTLVQAHNELGIVHRRAGRFEESRQAYLAALTIDPEHANAHRNLGVLYDLYLGKPDLALPHYEQYRALNGDAEPVVAKWVTEIKRRINQDTQTAKVQH